MRRISIILAVSLLLCYLLLILVTAQAEAANKGTVSLVGKSGSAPNITWEYRLTWVEGSLTEWRYTGDCITGASVTGEALANGWQVLTIIPGLMPPTGIGFRKTSGDPMTSGQVSGFRIEGSCDVAEDGDWGCHDNSGKVDGSLPVELSSFTAVTGDGKVTLSWRTETETNNIGFNIYRSEKKDGKFVKIGFVEGAGNSAFPHDYNFINKTAKSGKVYYYYLEDIDVEGNREKSDIVQSRSKRKLSTTWAKLKRR